MRLHGSSASSASVASRLYGTRSRRDSLGSDPELISFSDSDMHDITNQVRVFHQSLAVSMGENSSRPVVRFPAWAGSSLGKNQQP
ncbi:unnamed protein product [Nippostrongylus brasiliensis]|uniref:Movement protein n=1 Tax=Nippostrongylus brasiliensis TaxID=27835 RepID=A0A0N4YRH8_NIPBR|nr:unnamed protein product [Nippostrongylus brasiliensis]